MSCVGCSKVLKDSGKFWFVEALGKGLCLDCGKCAECNQSFSPRGYLYTNSKRPDLRFSLTPGLCQDCYDREWKKKQSAFL